MSKVKVAIIFDLPTPYTSPLFARLAREEGIELKVYYCSLRGGRDWEVSLDGDRNFEILPGRHGLNLAVLPRLLRERPDVLVISGYALPTMQLSILFCWLSKTPYVLLCESHLLQSRSALKRALKKLLLPPVIKKAAAYLPTGSKAKEYLAFYGAPLEKMFFFPNVPDVAFFETESEKHRRGRDALRQSLGIRTRYAILYVGRLIPHKGVHTLVEAFQHLRAERQDVSLLLVGGGWLTEELKQLAAQHHIPDVHFLGMQPHADLPRFYSLADIFVLPSYDEPWGTVVCEAMACALPVVATRAVGAAADLVHEGVNGFIVPEKDAMALASALHQLFLNPDLMRQMGLKSREIIRQWDDTFAMNNFLRAIALAHGTRDTPPCFPPRKRGGTKEGGHGAR